MPKKITKTQQKVETVMHEFKEGKLKSGKSGKRVTSRRQAIAIGLSEARPSSAGVRRPGGGKAGRRGVNGNKSGGRKAKRNNEPMKESSS